METTVGSYMIKSPYVGDANANLTETIELMLECGIRHLPIVCEGRLMGLVSERDLRGAISLPQSSQLTIGDVMQRDVYVATKATSLSSIVRTMQERKLGSTVITNAQNEVIGIFTVTDAMGILADLVDEADGQGAFIEDFEDSFEDWQTGLAI
jgi:CBS domain-containing protein